MTTLRLILGDQLSETISSLEGCNKKKDIIMMCEVMEEATYVKHHKKKLVFVFSAMRHFAQELLNKKYQVTYIKLDPTKETSSFTSEVKKIVSTKKIDNIILTEPGEYRLLQCFRGWQKTLNLPVEIKPDTRFLCTTNEFSAWVGKKKQCRMEYFYRYMRNKHDILMENDKPVGGKWNYDDENRKHPKHHLKIPRPYQTKADDVTQDVIKLVVSYFGEHFGDISPFHYAVTRRQALNALNQFIKERLPLFGDYQDAMLESEPWMFHSHISLYLNCGLLLPMECINAALNAYDKGDAPLNSVEGFIRQILGWREFVRGMYWLKMPAYIKKNTLNAKNKLPEFYWTGQTKMNCLKQCIQETKQHAYAHHLQRLMVIGNFALLAGIKPAEVSEWYLLVYADAYEWVELPNVIGMILFADGGEIASKPYASGGAYINKMSNYCKRCQYKVSVKNGPDACPYNYLYWDFLDRNRDKLKDNHRLTMMYKLYDKMKPDKKDAIKQDSKRFLEELI